MVCSYITENGEWGPETYEGSGIWLPNNAKWINTDVDVNANWRPPMIYQEKTTPDIPRKDNNSGGWLERIFMY